MKKALLFISSFFIIGSVVCATLRDMQAAIYLLLFAIIFLIHRIIINTDL